MKALLFIAAFIWVCGMAVIANEDAALTGKYAGADQFLSSIMK